MTLSPRDELPHDPGIESGWVETWGFELVLGAVTGVVRFTRVPSERRCACWVVLRNVDAGILVVRDDEVALPRRAGSLEVRGDGLWLELVCETAFEHWGIGLEAFGLRVDSPLDEVGDRLPVGLDVEWETDGSPVDERGEQSYAQAGFVHGELLVADDRVPIEGSCTRDHAWGAIEPPRWPPPAAPNGRF